MQRRLSEGLIQGYGKEAVCSKRAYPTLPINDPPGSGGIPEIGGIRLRSPCNLTCYTGHLLRAGIESLYNNSMRIGKIVLGALLALLVMGAIPNGLAYARSPLLQTPDRIYVEETGHWIEGKFLEMYNSADDPLLIFGYPITDQMTVAETGMKVQYFQRARMDLVGDLDGGTIELADLGRLLYSPGAPLVNIPSNSGACQLFPQTGKNVCYAFLQFYLLHNGGTFFGNPISDLEHQEDGRYVQYFERARMEWWPELPPEQRVMVTYLGSIYLEDYGQSLLMDEAQGDFIPGVGTVRLQARAFVEKALIPAGEQQTVFIIAQDQRLRPVPDVMVMVIINLPDGTQDIRRPPVTDEFGISRLDFTIPDLQPKQVVQVDVILQYQEEEVQTATWFRTWW
jgi:hypothetical protein